MNPMLSKPPKMYRQSPSVHTPAFQLDDASLFPKKAALALLLAFSSQALAHPTETSIRPDGFLPQPRACQGYFDICCRLASPNNAMYDPPLPSELHSGGSGHQFYSSQLPPGLWTPSILSTVTKLLSSVLLYVAEVWCSHSIFDEPGFPSCKATSSWPGFAGTNNVFSFGDSYTTTFFEETGQQPTADNPLGNPLYPGLTTAYPAPNWIDFLTVKYNQSSLLTYNLAVGGATVDQNLVVPYAPAQLSLTQQIYSRFVPAYDPKHGTALLSRPWYGNDTLIAIWIGINDVNISYQKGSNATSVLNRQIMAAYRDLLQFLYVEMGFRNFVLLNVPSIDRSPLTRDLGEEMQSIEKADLADFNGLLWKMARKFKKEVARKGNVWMYDANLDFSKALDDPTSFPQTSLLKNTTDCCEAYGPIGTPDQDTFYDVCGVPVNQYFWINSLHPTYPIHEVVAAQVAKLLEGKPNIC